MKQLFKYASLLFVAGALLVTSCSKKKDDDAVTPTVTKDSPRINLNLFYDETSPANQNWGGAEISANVPGDAPSAVIIVNADVEKNGTSPRELKRLYATKTVDGATSKFTLNISGFSSNSDGSIDIPSANKKKVTVEVPISTPTSGTKVVYEFWFTNGKGDYNTVTKRRQLGQGKVIINGDALVSYTSTVGDQFNSSPSYLVASGTGGALAEAALDTITDVAVKEATYRSVDLVFLQLTTAEAKGTGTKTGDTTYLVSPNKVKSLNFPGFGISGFNSNKQNYTVYAPYTGDFSTATEATIKALTFTSGVASTQKIVSGGIYKFETTYSEGYTKAGLIKVNSITRADNGLVSGVPTTGVFTRSASVSIKAVTKISSSSTYTSF